MKKRILSLILALSMFVSLLPMVASAAEPDAAQSATVAANSPYYGKTLEIYGMGTQDSYTDFSQFNEQFTWMQKAAAVEWAEMNGVTLVFKGIYDQNTVIADINAGGHPDIIYQNNEFPRIANVGIVSAFTQSEYNKLAAIAGNEWLDMVKYGTQSMGFVVPWTGTVMCYYNRTMFEEYGVKTPRKYFEEGNWTWDTFMEVMEEMTRDLDWDGTIDTYGLNGNSWGNFINPWATNDKGELISVIDEPWIRDFYQLKYDAYTVKKVTARGGNNITTNVIFPMFAMQLSNCESYNFEHLYQYIPNGNELEVAPAPEWRGTNGETLGTTKVTQQAFHLASTCDERAAAVDLLAYILKCGLKYMEDYSFGIVETDYEGLQGTCELSANYLNAFNKMQKRRQKEVANLIEYGVYDAEYVQCLNDYLDGRDKYTYGNYLGVTSLIDYSEITEMPPASAISAIRTKYQNALNTYNTLYIGNVPTQPTDPPTSPTTEPTKAPTVVPTTAPTEPQPEVDVSYLVFELNEDGQSYYVQSYNKDLCGELTIPATYNGLPVTAIGEYAFFGCTALTAVTIPGSVTAIGDSAFQNCENLADVTLMEGIATIGQQAFFSCNALTKVKLPDSVTVIDAGAFSICLDLAEVTLGAGLLTIERQVFYGCDSLDGIVIPDGVTTIGANAFYHCDGLTGITIPDSVTTIDAAAFESCQNLSSVTIGTGVTTIGDGAFSYCYSLSDVYYGGSEEQWSAIEIGSNNVYLLNADIHFDSATEPYDIPLALGENSVYVPANMDYVECTFVPQESGAYSFFSVGEWDTKAELWDDKGNCLAYNDDGVTNCNFQLSAQLEAGKTYILKVGYFLGTDTGTISVFVEPSALESLTFTPVTIAEGTMGYFDVSWDQASQSDKRYYVYNLRDILLQSTFTATFANGTELSGQNDGFYYDDEWQSFDCFADQSYENRWVSGNTYEITITVMGMTVKLPVIIEKSPLVSLTISDISVEEYSNGYMSEAWNEETQSNQQYFEYDIWNLLSKTAYTASFSDGTVLTGFVVNDEGHGFYYDGVWYGFTIGSDQCLENLWTIDNPGQLTVEIASMCITVPVTITPRTFDGTLALGENTVTITEPEQWVEYSFVPQKSGVYNFFSVGQQDTRAELWGDKGEYLAYNDDGGEDTNFLISAQLTAGQTYILKMRYYQLDAIGTFQVMAEVSRLESIIFQPISVIEGTCGYKSEFFLGDIVDYYYCYDGDSLMRRLAYTATFADGTVITGTGDELTYNGNSYGFIFESTQDYHHQWLPGNTYTMKVFTMGLEAEVLVTITPTPLASITFTDVFVEEYTDGCYSDDWDEESQSDQTYYHYDIWAMLNKSIYTATFTDGSVRSEYIGNGDGFCYEDELYSYEMWDEQDYDQQWTAGNTYEIEVSIMGKSGILSVTVVESLNGEACPHEKVVTLPAKDATCTETGLTQGKMCALCCEILVSQEEIPVNNHSWDAGVITKPATCKEEGVKTFTCSRCQGTMIAIILKLAKHTYAGACDTTCDVCGETRTAKPHTYTDDKDTYCNVCGTYAYPGGNTLVKENGIWYHVVDRQKVTDTTLVEFNGFLFYVNNGVVDFKATIMFKYKDRWHYIQEGQFVSKSGLTKVGGTWYYLKNGYMDTTDTLVKFNGIWFHVKNGVIDYKPAIVTFNGIRFYTNDGQIVYTNGLTKVNGTWYNLKNGEVVNSTTLVKFNGIWFYVKNGVVDFNATTLCKFNGIWFYVKKGEVDFNATTLCKFNGIWFYVKKGEVDFNATTLCKFNGYWFYVKKGQVDFNATTLCKFNGYWFYVKNGQVDFNATTLCKFNGYWFYVKNGQVDFNATTLAYFNGYWFYVKNGQVDFNYSGRFYYNGSYHTIKAGVKI